MGGNKRTIPQIRERLREIAEENGIPEINDLVEEMYRDPPVRRAPVTSQNFTPKLAKEIREYAQKHPKKSEHDIGTHFEVDSG